MSERDLAVAVLTGPCPCEPCAYAHTCATRLRACQGFADYVAGASEKSWRSAERRPTPERWLMLFPPPSRKRLTVKQRLKQRRLLQRRYRERQRAAALSAQAIGG